MAAFHPAIRKSNLPKTADELDRQLTIQELTWEAEDGLYTRLSDSQTSDSHDSQDFHDSQDSRINTASTEEDDTPESPEVSRRLVQAWDRGAYGKLSLGLFLRLALEADKKASAKKHYSPLFELARYCRAYPPMASLTGEEVLTIILPYLSDYSEQQQLNFLHYFAIAKSIPSENALERALQMPLLRHSVSPLYDRFVSMAGWMQKELNQENIFLPQERVSKLLKVSRPTASNLVKLAVRDGYLTLVKEAIAHKRAAEYRFNGDKFPALKERH